jgi:uncharacterized protein (TIGR00251 family)
MNTRITDENIIISVKVVPNSSKNEIVCILDGILKIKIKAPAVENKANSELVKFLAKQIGIPKSSVKILSGETSKIKKICITGCELEKFKFFCDKIISTNQKKEFL